MSENTRGEELAIRYAQTVLDAAASRRTTLGGKTVWQIPSDYTARQNLAIHAAYESGLSPDDPFIANVVDGFYVAVSEGSRELVLYRGEA